MTCFGGNDFLSRVYAFRCNNTPDARYVYVELEVTKQVDDKSVHVTHELFSYALKVRGNLWEAAGRLGFDCFQAGSARPHVSGFRVTAGLAASSLLYLSPRLTPRCGGVAHSQVSTVEKCYE